MADVHSLIAYRAARQARRRVDAALEPAAPVFHPSLRWIAGYNWQQAHSRLGEAAGCGAEGTLMLATPGVPLCGECFPSGDSTDAFPEEHL